MNLFMITIQESILKALKYEQNYVDHKVSKLVFT